MATVANTAEKSLYYRMLDALSEISVGVKMRVVLFCVGVLPPLVMLILLYQFGEGILQNALALYIAVAVALYYPMTRLLEELIVLRQTRRINTYVDEVKSGRRTPHFVLPREKGDEHDFLRLKRNIFWMVQGLKTRETRLQETLQQLKLAQSQVWESIQYASRIQRSFLPSARNLKSALGDYFLFWLPRDGVGGDAYWINRQGRYTFLAVFDCTGHGVPGAFLTLIVNSLFEQNVDPGCYGDPGRLLAKMNVGLKNALSQHGTKKLSDDGLEGAVCCLDRDQGVMFFAGARGFILLSGADGVREMRGDRSGIGFVNVPMDQQFANHRIPLQDVDGVYLFTDGVSDQIGGPRKLPYGRSRLRALLEEHKGLAMDEQVLVLEREFQAYKGGGVQRDDVTVLGFSTRAFRGRTSQ